MTYCDLQCHRRSKVKSGNQTKMNNYRPISVLSILSKIFEKHVNDSFYSYDLIL